MSRLEACPFEFQFTYTVSVPAHPRIVNTLNLFQETPLFWFSLSLDLLSINRGVEFYPFVSSAASPGICPWINGQV
jgi:hypothetical protein